MTMADNSGSLTVPDEFLLLTLKDDGGEFIDLPAETYRAGFVGAALMELSLQDRLDYDAAQVWVVDPAPTGSEGLDHVLARLSAADFSSRSEQVIKQMIDMGDLVRNASLTRLCAKRILIEAEGRVLWFLKTRRYPITNDREIREVKLRLLDVLLHDGLPNPRDVCLMSLAETCGIIGQIVPQANLEMARDRLAKVARMERIGQNVRQHIQMFERAMILAIHADI